MKWALLVACALGANPGGDPGGAPGRDAGGDPGQPERRPEGPKSKARGSGNHHPASTPPLRGSAQPERGILVDLTTAIPDVVLDLRYATPDNFLEEQVYPKDARCLLRPETIARLKKAADRLRQDGYRLRLYDCYRPIAVQWKMWKILPRPGYVADPRKGSNHNRGTAVDLTLATADGKEVEMPTPFDTFSKAAHHGYPGASKEATRNRERLRAAMEAAGFRKNRMEWWHYSIPGARRYPVLDEPLVAP